MSYYTNIDHRLYRATCGWTDGRKCILAHNDSPQTVLDKATYVGSETDLINWVLECTYKYVTIYVVCPNIIVYNGMTNIRPDLKIILI